MLSRLAHLLCLVLTLRVAVLFIEYILDVRGTRRFHVETATFILVVCGLVLRHVKAGGGKADANQHEVSAPGRAASWPEWSICLGFMAGAVLLYWPALGIGLLSDDFVLVERASGWHIGPVTPSLFRPLPLFLWGVLLHLGGTPMTLHFFNIVVHGTNAFLVTKIVQGWLHKGTWSILAGLLFLTSPLAPEAVAWCSGVFDVLSTSLVLALVLHARTYGQRAPQAQHAVTLLLGIGALMSKETAVIAPALLLLDVAIRGRALKTVLVDAALLGAAFAVFATQRLYSAFGATAPRIDRYVFQRGLFGSFGSFAVPWHADVIRNWPWVPILAALGLLALLCMFWMAKPLRQRTRLTLAAAGWVLVCILPVWPVLGVSPDLQGSRYLYLPAVGWVGLVAAMAVPENARSRFREIFGILLMAGLGIVGAWGTRVHLEAWLDAAQMRDAVERAAPIDEGCPSVVLMNLPDAVRGAFVFRNGAREAFERDLGRRVSAGSTADSAADRCSFRWDENTSTFASVQR